jgi:transposase InsO family protein
MKEHSGTFPVKKMARVLKVTRSRYYAWLNSSPSEHDRRDAELTTLIKQSHQNSREAYGSPRVKKDLVQMGIICSKKRVARIMRENGLKARKKRRFKATTDSMHDLPIAPNIVARQFSVDLPNRVWVSDITYIWTKEGWLYLCIIIDLFSRMVVGWSMKSRITADLALSALSMAVVHRNPSDGLLFHSDRGVQYAAETFRERLCEFKMIQSMSRKGDCWDNACAESFFATLKTEEVFHRTYQTRDEAMNSIFEYIAVFYNRQRRHSSLDFLSPVEYELQSGCIKNVA